MGVSNNTEYQYRLLYVELFKRGKGKEKEKK
jgi:hypothetical protein